MGAGIAAEHQPQHQPEHGNDEHPEQGGAHRPGGALASQDHEDDGHDGQPKLERQIQTPVVPTAVEMATFENPKLPNIRKVIPTATAPPAGTVFEMAEDVWVSKNPCR